jgi:CRP-like cAMP-binding protein
MTTAEAVLAAEAQSGATFGVIVSGQASVSVHGRPARSLGPGDYFGEMALIDHSYRSAEITAETELRCLLFTAWVFRPFALQPAMPCDDGMRIPVTSSAPAPAAIV